LLVVSTFGSAHSHVIRTIKDHGSIWDPANVKPLSAPIFEGERSEGIAHEQLARQGSIPRETRFLHKLYSLAEIVEDSQKEAHAVVDGMSGVLPNSRSRLQQLEVLGYDLNTCMGERPSF